MKKIPEQWHLEADVVAIGSGGGGLAAAITAHELGASALVLERSDQVGGVTAFSMGEVWIPGNHLEIGRAACRVRVCQSVWISVVAVSLKTQNNYINQSSSM